MGCNVSRIETEGEGRVRPVYRRRIDEILRHSDLRSQHLSKKNLLRDTDESRSPPSSEGSVDSVKTNKEEEKGNKQDDKTANKDEKVVALIALEEVLMIDSEEEDDNESRLSNFSGALICPGSPSFRVYCIESSCDEKEEEEDGDQDKEECSTHKKVETGDIQVSQSRTRSDEGASCRKIRKAKRGGKFKRVILKPKGKNFLLVKSCYIPSCVGNHNDTRLIAAKA